MVSLKKKGLGMKNKTFIQECGCIHCQQKLNQINNAKIYWDKLILRKKVGIVSWLYSLRFLNLMKNIGLKILICKQKK